MVRVLEEMSLKWAPSTGFVFCPPTGRLSGWSLAVSHCPYHHNVEFNQAILSALLFLMTIEPLISPFRRHEGHDICIGGTTVATGLYILFCWLFDIPFGNTKWCFDVFDATRSVQVYCDIPCANISLRISALLSLSRTLLKLEDLSNTKAFRSSRHQLIRLLIYSLQTDYYDGFSVWFRRARSVHDRLLAGG